MYIYPDHLKSKATLWLWQLRDIGILGICGLVSILAATQGECYNPKKAIFDRATEEVNKQLKRQMILYKRRIKELELQIELLEEENQRLKENR